MNESVVLADATIPMDELLEYLGYPSPSIPSSIRCPVHAGGQETHPSAHIYGKYDTIWCYTCNKQYTPSEIAASVWSTERDAAAQMLLEKWVPSPEQIKKALDDFRSQKIPTVDEVSQKKLDFALKKFKRRVSLESYRRWIQESSTFLNNFIGLPDRVRFIALNTFIDRLETDLGRESDGYLRRKSQKLCTESPRPQS